MADLFQPFFPFQVLEKEHLKRMWVETSLVGRRKTFHPCPMVQMKRVALEDQELMDLNLLQI